ncbi:ArsA-related P-loop ATPase [Leekyejoonella antrihumi]|uniref:ATPase n=1 Tax=Leekyejoonella antrihumi TaxID=1660198 RepID=A0A563DW39_9MICO|nr:ArsA-related P-loop ATPase [Leekyejoonella antrihumi]TWP34329.1 ATPase [Leekyejoonella antrihumi]
MAGSAWDGVRLHVVTGKGGTGKTSVAAALATAYAATGKHVLIAEVEERQGISQVFDVPQLGTTETQVARGQRGGDVYGLAVDAKTALMEYLQMFYKLGMAGGLLERFGVVDFATTIAPGLRDVLLIGKVYEAVRRRPGRRGHRGERPYDVVVLDAPPTGRIGRFLGVNHEIAGLAKMGPVKSQADSITALLQSRQTAVHIVTLLEEMPVQETVDAARDLAALQLPVGAIIVNQEREPIVSAEARALVTGDAFDAGPLESDLRALDLRVGPTLVGGLVQAGQDLDERLRMQDRERKQLAALDRPTYHLPFLHEGLDAGGLRELAGALGRQMIAGAPHE